MTLFQAFGQFAGQGGGAGPAAAAGMVLMLPTSIANSSGTATLGANGQVTFSSVASVSLNGCFTADYDNYIVSVRTVGVGDQNIDMRIRASGADNTTVSSYTRNYVDAANTTLTANRFTGAIWSAAGATAVNGGGMNITFYGPFLAQATGMRTTTTSAVGGALIRDTAGTHNQTVSYDGFSLIAGTGTISGVLQVYGVKS